MKPSKNIAILENFDAILTFRAVDKCNVIDRDFLCIYEPRYISLFYYIFREICQITGKIYSIMVPEF